MSRAPRIVSLSTSLFVVALAASAGATTPFDPAHRFRTLETTHFSIHFHQGEEGMARRLAAIAEDVWRRLEPPLGVRPPPHTEVVLADWTELSNGFATPVPYDTVVVTAAWPSGAEFIGRTDDWLRLVFTHEFTHIVHLDRSEGWARAVRQVFGRLPLAFPNVYLPEWQIEGLATYEESALTGEGRLHAGDFGAIVDEAARCGRFEPLDRVNGGVSAWPSDYGAYAYGAGFHRYLADRFGLESLAALAAVTARRVPYTASRAFDEVYGESLGVLWREYQNASSRAGAAIDNDPTPAAGARRLTRQGFIVAGPRFDRFSRAQRIIYSARGPDGFPTLYAVPTDGSRPTALAERYLGSTTGLTDRTMYFDQLELRRSSGLYGDLYALDRATGRVSRLTQEARLLDPDASPDGATLVAVQSRPGRRNLVTIALTSGSLRPVTLVSQPDTQFNTPRWSPDGRLIAAERHRPGHQSEIVVVDPASRSVRIVASETDTRFVTPAWRPDGRAIVAAADVREGPFNLYEISLDALPSAPLRQLSHTTGGAMAPDVSPDGAAIVFVGYTVDGFDVFMEPYPPADRTLSSNPSDRVEPRSDQGGAAPTPPLPEAAAASVRYSPFHTLKPTSWFPTVQSDGHQVRIGAGTSGTDVLGYHSYQVSSSWLAAAPAGATTPNRRTPDWTAAYAYQRWQLTPFASASSATSFFAGGADAAGVPLTATERERQIQVGVLLGVAHVRTSQRALTSYSLASDELSAGDERLTVRRAAWRAGWSFTSARQYGYSVSPEGGIAFGATIEVVRQALGASADADAVTADGRMYWSPFGRHQVLAVRLAAGRSSGDPILRRTFHLGGAQSNGSTLDFGRNAISLLRGFESDTFAGNHVALVNADYRFPLARPQRGHGTWPVLVHTVHAAVFADMGHAWTRSFTAADLKASVGAELSAKVVAGYWFPLTATAGAAWGRDGSGVVRNGASIYVRLGGSF